MGMRGLLADPIPYGNSTDLSGDVVAKSGHLHLGTVFGSMNSTVSYMQSL